jgi:cob(I)alamin adenosyltransferase
MSALCILRRGEIVNHLSTLPAAGAEGVLDRGERIPYENQPMSGAEGREGGEERGGAAEGGTREAAVFNEPRLVINRVYTRQGDGGLTRLVGGQRVSKDDPRIDAYGTVDELNSLIGVARETLRENLGAAPQGCGEGLRELGAILVRVQHELFNLGSILATLPEDVHPKQPRVTQAEIDRLEVEMDRCQAELAPLRSFVLPGGSRLNAELHVARTVCRRAERCCVLLSRSENVDLLAIAYLNRLSDALFVWSRWASLKLGVEESLWEPNKAASAQADPSGAPPA